MANKFKGEVEFTSRDDKKYILSFSANALCELEEVVGMSLDDVVAKLQSDTDKMKLSEIRKIFWAGLLDHQPDVSIEDTKRILSGISPKDMGELVGKAFRLSMSDGEQEDGPRPPEPDQRKNGAGPAP